jgi:hypothetical protein
LLLLPSFNHTSLPIFKSIVSRQLIAFLSIFTASSTHVSAVDQLNCGFLDHARLI